MSLLYLIIQAPFQHVQTMGVENQKIWQELDKNGPIEDTHP